MKAGKLDRSVSFLKLGSGVDDGYTTSAGAMLTQGVRKARYIPAMAREIFENQGREGKTPVVWEFRSDTLTRQVDMSWKLSYDGRQYDIKGVQEIGRREGIRIEAVAGD